MNFSQKKGYHNNKRLNKEFLTIHTQLKKFFEYDINIADALKIEFRYYSLYKLGYAEVDKNLINKMNKLLKNNELSKTLVDISNYPFKKLFHSREKIDHSGSYNNKKIIDMIKEIRDRNEKLYTYRYLNELLGFKNQRIYQLVRGILPAKKLEVEKVKELYNNIVNNTINNVIKQEVIKTEKEFVKVTIEMPVNFKGTIKIKSE